jgi:hypothetical protein
MEQKLLGDLTEETLKKMGADKLVKFYERTTGRPCNCANRKQVLNNLHRAAQRLVAPHVKKELPIVTPQHKLPTKPVDEQ